MRVCQVLGNLSSEKPTSFHESLSAPPEGCDAGGAERLNVVPTAITARIAKPNYADVGRDSADLMRLILRRVSARGKVEVLADPSETAPPCATSMPRAVPRGRADPWRARWPPCCAAGRLD